MHLDSSRRGIQHQRVLQEGRKLRRGEHNAADAARHPQQVDALLLHDGRDIQCRLPQRHLLRCRHTDSGKRCKPRSLTAA